MESRYGRKIGIWWVYCLSIAACQSKNISQEAVYDLSLSQSGDVIYRLGNGLYSNFFKDFSDKDKRYSHVGIIYRTDMTDTVFVIHAEGDDLSGIGGIKKVTATTFLQDTKDWAIYRLKSDDSIRQRVAEQVLFYFKKKDIAFDMAFDTEDSTAFYCSELIAHCINNACNAKVIMPNTTKNNRPYIAIDDTYLTNKMQLILYKLENTAQY